MQGQLFDLTGRIALVTGAARGLGRAIALGLARQGAAVAVADCNQEGMRETAAAVRDLGVQAHSVACDISCEAQVRTMVTSTEAELGPIDILVNNAGITKRIPLFEWTEEDWNEVIRINQIGTFLVAREVGKQMVLRNSGSIVNMSALGGGLVGLGRGNGIYSSTKGAIVALTRDLAAEWAQYGVRVNAVAPGWCNTDMNTVLLKNSALVERLLDRVPLGRLAEPEDIVGAVVFLASNAAAMVTGHLIPIDGGVAAIASLSNLPVVR